MLAPDGRCKTFDSSANGYVRAEGAGALLLKPLSQAIQDGDAIYALILASAVNHGGKANSLTAPRVDAQAEVVAEAYNRAGIDPATVGYIETHGTGTELGDPVEVNALKKAFAKLAGGRGVSSPREHSCGLGSVKTHVGHLETAAGITGLIQAILAIQHRTLPPLRHFQAPNRYLDLAGSPFFLVTSPRHWEQPVDDRGKPAPRRAGVSSFGFGGVNAHVVIEEHRAPAPVAAPQPPGIRSPLLILSGKNAEALRRSSGDLLSWLRGQLDGPADARPFLSHVAGTLQNGREPLSERLAFVADSYEEAARKLEGWLAGASGIRGLWQGTAGSVSDGMFNLSASEDREFFTNLYANNRLERLAELWVRGVDLPWLHFDPAGARSKVHLPGYPFARQRYWPDSALAKSAPVRTGIGDRLDALPVGLEAARTQGVAENAGAELLPAMAMLAPRWVQWDSPSPGNGEPEPGTVIVFRARRDGGLASALVDPQPKGRRIIVHLARRWHKASAELYAIDPSKRTDYEAVLRAGQGPLDLYFLGSSPVASFDSGDAAAYAAAQETGVLALFKLLQATEGLPSSVRVRSLCVVTRSLHPVFLPEGELNPTHGAVTGLVKVACEEQFGFPMVCIDIEAASPGESDASALRAVCDCLRGGSLVLGAAVLALRRGKLFRQVLAAGLGQSVGGRSVAFRQNGVYVILGGAAGLGAHIARFPAAHFQARLVLVGRRAADKDRMNFLQELETQGGQTFYMKGNLERKGFVHEVLREAEARFGCIHGIIHSVATMADESLSMMSDAAFRSVFELQTMSTFELVGACRGRNLDFLGVFSSAAPIIGIPGTANYSAGCSARDALGLAWARATGRP